MLSDTSSTARRVRQPEKRRVTEDFGQEELDAHIEGNVTLDALTKAIIRNRETPAELVRKLKKGRRIGVHALPELRDSAYRAVFDIPTCHGYIVQPDVQVNVAGRAQIGVGATILPWTQGENGSKEYLCLYVPRATVDVRCKLAVARLAVEDDVRSILVSDHVCERLIQRAEVKGSPVAYIALSIQRAGLVVHEQADRNELLLEVVDHHQRLIGYCPISKKKCALLGARSTLADDVKKCIPVQPRWRLKTFTLPEYCKPRPFTAKPAEV